MLHFIRKYFGYFIYISVTLGISYILAINLGLFELPDGFFYYVLGDYLLHGRLFTVMPFNAQVPQTLFGPLYSIVLGWFIPQPFPWAMTGLPFLQLFLIFLAGLWIFIIAKLIIGKKWAIPALILFLCQPFLLIYAMTLMSEAVTIFLLTTYCLLLVLLFKKKTILPPSFLVLVGCILTLTKNAYVLITLVSFPLWFYFLWKDRRHLTAVKGMLGQIPIIIGFIGLLFWIQFNKTHHNIYSLTNYTGRHLYNNVVHSGHLLPDKESPIYKEFISRMGTEERFALPEWEAELVFIPDFNSKKLTEAEIDKKFLAFSLAAIKRQPFAYIKHVFEVAWGDLTTPPYHAKLLASVGAPDPTCPDCGVLACHITWNANLCQPQILHSPLEKLWIATIWFNRSIYPWGMIILTIIAGLGIIQSIYKKNIALIAIAGIFLLFLFVQSAAQRIEGRYLIPLYPMYTLCIINGIKLILDIISKPVGTILKKRND